MLLIVLPLRFPYSQGSAGSSGTLEPRYLVDVPTAGMVDKGSLVIDACFFQEGGALVGLSYGIWNRFSVGLSYGGSHLIGGDKPVWNPAPGVNVKLRIVEENPTIPALAIGFDTQGNDGYLPDLDRYTIKSPGLYACLSKNYTFLGYLSIHAGVNYSFERSDGNTDLNYFCGVEKTVGPVFSLICEYNLATNDNSGAALGTGRGYLNACVRWSVGSGFTLSVDVKDVTGNAEEVVAPRRTVSLEFARNL